MDIIDDTEWQLEKLEIIRDWVLLEEIEILEKEIRRIERKIRKLRKILYNN